MINFILIITILFGCPLEDSTINGRRIKRCFEWSLTIKSAGLIGPVMTGPNQEWTNFTPLKMQFITITHIGPSDYWDAYDNCQLRGDFVPDEECVTNEPIRGQTNWSFTTNCTPDCRAELGETVAITDWINVGISDLDLDFDGDIDLKDYYYLQQIRILQ